MTTGVISLRQIEAAFRAGHGGPDDKLTEAFARAKAKRTGGVSNEARTHYWSYLTEGLGLLTRETVRGHWYKVSRVDAYLRKVEHRLSAILGRTIDIHDRNIHDLFAVLSENSVALDSQGESAVLAECALFHEVMMFHNAVLQSRSVLEVIALAPRRERRAARRSGRIRDRCEAHRQRSLGPPADLSPPGQLISESPHLTTGPPWLTNAPQVRVRLA